MTGAPDVRGSVLSGRGTADLRFKGIWTDIPVQVGSCYSQRGCSVLLLAMRTAPARVPRNSLLALERCTQSLEHVRRTLQALAQRRSLLAWENVVTSSWCGKHCTRRHGVAHRWRWSDVLHHWSCNRLGVLYRVLDEWRWRSIHWMHWRCVTYLGARTMYSTAGSVPQTLHEPEKRSTKQVP